MKSIILRLVAISIYLALFCVAITGVLITITHELIFSFASILCIILIMIGLFAIASFLLCLSFESYYKRIKTIKLTLYTFFIMYCLTIVIVLILRNITFLSANNIKAYNLIPFKTITGYYVAYKNQTVNTISIFQNVIGNIIIFLPMGIFLPLLFKRLNKTRLLLITILSIVLCIELTQFFTNAGILDIDDVILNMFGALLGYFSMKLNFMKNIIGNIKTSIIERLH